MKKVSFEEMGALVVTMAVDGAVDAGQSVMMSGDGAVKVCGAGKRGCGVAVSVSVDGFAGVQVRGAAEAAYSGAVPVVGWNKLTGDGAGGFQVAADGQESGEYLVVSVDTVGKTAVILL